MGEQMKLQQGYVQIYTGDGKGKTTAAMGLALRALGAGLRVCIIQFLKKKPTSELKILSKLSGVSVHRFGRESWVRPPFKRPDLLWAEKGLAFLRATLQAGTYDCVIADELCTAASLGLVAESEVLACLAARLPRVELILTGRNAGPALKRKADLVTEMRAVKHYFSKQVHARQGIEF